MKHVYGLLKAELARLNRSLPADAKLCVPSYTTFRTRIREYSEYDVYARRYGEEAARKRFQHRGVGETTTHIQQRYEVDHMRFDLIVIDRKWRIPLGRPWLTLILDRHSRMPAGYHIGFETPNTYSVLRALRSALLPKQRVLRRFARITESWPCWGKFEELVCDNGLEIHAGALRRAAFELGITLTFCGARDPQRKGTIERFFRTLSTQFVHMLPGTTRSNAKDRGDQNPAKEARIDLEELEELLLKYLVDVYMRQHHRGLGDVPVKVWEESALHHPPVLPGDAERLKLSLSLTKTLSLTEKGICFDGLQYTSHELTQLRRKASAKHGAKPAVIVKIDPDDLMMVHVALKGQPYLKVPHVSPEYAEGLTMDQHRAIRAHDRQRVKESTTATLLESKLQLQAMVDELYKKRKAGKPSKDKAALKEALKAVNALTDVPEGASAVKKVVSAAKKITGYFSKMFESPYLDAADTDYEVSFAAPKTAATKGGDQ
jgi:putative transposase